MPKNGVLFPAALVLVSLARVAEAGQLTDLQLYDGTSNSPVVTVSYSNADGSGQNSVQTWADPQVSGGTNAPIYYCIDLWHDNYLGSTYTFVPTSSRSYATSSFSDVDNRLAWLVNQAQGTVDERAAVQLAIWYTVDNLPSQGFAGFSYTGGDSTLRGEYNRLISFAGYDPAVHYGAQFWAADHDPGNRLYQDLISYAEPVNHTSAVPEPGALALASLGVVGGLAIYGRRGRKASRRAA
jgi:hypothetical protein